MSDAADPRALTPFPTERTAAPPDPLAGDWAEGLRGPVRPLAIPAPLPLGALGGAARPQPAAAAPAPGASEEQRTEQADLKTILAMREHLLGTAPAPEVEAPAEWASAVEDQLASHPPPRQDAPLPDDLLRAIESLAPATGAPPPAPPPPAPEPAGPALAAAAAPVLDASAGTAPAPEGEASPAAEAAAPAAPSPDAADSPGSTDPQTLPVLVLSESQELAEAEPSSAEPEAPAAEQIDLAEEIVDVTEVAFEHEGAAPSASEEVEATGAEPLPDDAIVSLEQEDAVAEIAWDGEAPGLPVQEWTAGAPAGDQLAAWGGAAAPAPAADGWGAPAPAAAPVDSWAPAAPAPHAGWRAPEPAAAEASWPAPAPPPARGAEAPWPTTIASPEHAAAAAPDAEPWPGEPAVVSSGSGWALPDTDAAPLPEDDSLFAPLPPGASLSEPEPPAAAEPPAAPPAAAEQAEEFALVHPDDADLLVPVVEPEAAPPEGALAVHGEHRVAVHTRAGRTRRGLLRDVDLAAPDFKLHPPTGGGWEIVKSDEVKAVFFMLPPGEKPAPGRGRPVRVIFHDGRVIEGMRDGEDALAGFFLVPADAARTNTRRIFVARASLAEVVDA